MLLAGALAGLRNSTRLGEVTFESRVRRNLVRAGLRVGDGRQRDSFASACSRWMEQVVEYSSDRPKGPASLCVSVPMKPAVVPSTPG